ncbi:LOW QUALITY PROTEIN: hypothetical protein HID58_003563, partial [Brassica napus]
INPRGFYSNRKNQTRYGFSSPTREFAFPHGGAMRARNLSRPSGDDATDPRDGERSVRVLPHLSDYPMRHGDDGERHEFEGRRDAGERAHQKLVRRRAVEPVVEIRGSGEPIRRLEISGRHTVSEPRLGSWYLNPPEYPVLGEFLESKSNARIRDLD